MPTLFLSPSAQEYNEYATGGSEEQYMNLLADAMEPYLRSTGIVYIRNNPDDTLSQIIQQSNAGNYDFHLALHSNAAPNLCADGCTAPMSTITPPVRKDGAVPRSSPKISKILRSTLRWYGRSLPPRWRN